MLLCGMMEVYMSSSYCIEKIQKDRRARKRYALKTFHVEGEEWKLKPLPTIAKIKPMTTLARSVVSTVDLARCCYSTTVHQSGRTLSKLAAPALQRQRASIQVVCYKTMQQNITERDSASKN